METIEHAGRRYTVHRADLGEQVPAHLRTEAEWIADNRRIRIDAPISAYVERLASYELLHSRGSRGPIVRATGEKIFRIPLYVEACLCFAPAFGPPRRLPNGTLSALSHVFQLFGETGHRPSPVDEIRHWALPEMRVSERTGDAAILTVCRDVADALERSVDGYPLKDGHGIRHIVTAIRATCDMAEGANAAVAARRRQASATDAARDRRERQAAADLSVLLREMPPPRCLVRAAIARGR